MTDNQIIKAFECCYLYDVMFCDKCPNKDTCGEIDVGESILDLINRQQAEIERLKSKVNRLKRYDEERDIRLHARLIATAKSEAYKECIEKVKEEIVEALRSNFKAQNERMLKTNEIDDFVRLCDGKIMALRGIDDFLDNLLKEVGCETDA